MHTIQHFLHVWREAITKYVVDRSIFTECQGTDRRRGWCLGGGGGSRGCAWMTFDALGSRNIGERIAGAR